MEHQVQIQLPLLSEDAHVDSVLWTIAFGTSANRATVTLTGADYFHFNNLTIQNDGPTSTYHTAIELKEGANWNMFTNNNILGDTTPTSTSVNASVIYSNSGSSIDNNNTFDNNTIWGGSYGTYFYGDGTTALEGNNTFTNNWFKDNIIMGLVFIIKIILR